MKVPGQCCVTVLMVVGLAAACRSANPDRQTPLDFSSAPKPVRAAKSAVRITTESIEAEEFRLQGAKVVALQGASRGQAVLFDSDGAHASLSVQLQRGTYEVTAYVQGADEKHDAVLLSVGGHETRLSPQDAYGKIVPTAAFQVAVDKDGPCKIALTADETGVYVDRIVLKRLK
jgi:hypothetical protein